MGGELVKAITSYPRALWGNVKKHPFIWSTLATLFGGTQAVSHCNQVMADPNPVADNSDHEVEYNGITYFHADDGNYYSYRTGSPSAENAQISSKKKFDAAKKAKAQQKK